MHRALAPSLAVLMSTGCYAAHTRDEATDAGTRSDVRTPDARVIEGPDASVALPACTSLVASAGVLLTHPAPNDFSLGAAQVTGPRTALVAFSSSNDGGEMDVQRWGLAVDLDTGAPLLPERVTFFGPTRVGAPSRVVAGPRSIFAFTSSEEEGCMLRRVDALGAPLAPARQLNSIACSSARVAPSGQVVFQSVQRLPSIAAFFEWVDDAGVHTMSTGIGAGARELGGMRFTWAFNADAAIEILATDATGTRFGTWPELRWRNVEGAGQGSLLRLIAVGDRLVGAWISARGEVELAYADEAVLHATGIEALTVASLDLMSRGDELWLVYVAAGAHADARTTLARFDLSLEERAARTEVGRESFATTLRLLSSPRGALLIEQGQRADAAGGHNLFAIPIACTDASTRPAGCAAWRATVDACTPPCDAIPNYIWEGSDCIESQCGCTGPDCAFAYRDRDACVADHALCAPSRCETTGGVWIASNTRYCDSPVCGDDPRICDETPDAVCHCGLNALYDARSGCVPGFCVGRPNNDQLRCTQSGGTWGTFCTHSHCGEAPDPCVDMACRCADNEVWSEVAGCVVSAECTRCAGG